MSGEREREEGKDTVETAAERLAKHPEEVAQQEQEDKTGIRRWLAEVTEELVRIPARIKEYLIRYRMHRGDFKKLINSYLISCGESSKEVISLLNMVIQDFAGSREFHGLIAEISKAKKEFEVAINTNPRIIASNKVADLIQEFYDKDETKKISEEETIKESLNVARSLLDNGTISGDVYSFIKEKLEKMLSKVKVLSDEKTDVKSYFDGKFVGNFYPKGSLIMTATNNDDQPVFKFVMNAEEVAKTTMALFTRISDHFGEETITTVPKTLLTQMEDLVTSATKTLSIMKDKKVVDKE